MMEDTAQKLQMNQERVTNASSNFTALKSIGQELQFAYSFPNHKIYFRVLLSQCH